MKRTLGLFGAALAISLLTQIANAAFSDILTVYNDAGTISQLLTVTEQQEIKDPSNVWRLNDGIADPAQYGNPTVLFEPGGTIISDIFGVAVDPASVIAGTPHFYLAFMSDLEGAGVVPAVARDWFLNAQLMLDRGISAAPIPFLEEPGVVYDATRYLNRSSDNWTATFQSDYEVPEPTTILAGALLLLPFGASTVRILRKKV